MTVSDDDLDELRSWAAGECEEIDWTAVELPPCVNTVRDGASTVARRSRVVRAYYDPKVTHPQLDREVRIADGQAVVVSPDGSILATWRVPSPDSTEQPIVAPARRAEKRADSSRGLRRGPRDQAGLLRMLGQEGVRMERTTKHIRVYAPLGIVYMPSTPSDARSVSNSVALLRRYGCTLRHDS
jgi:hypothetical protein